MAVCVQDTGFASIVSISFLLDMNTSKTAPHKMSGAVSFLLLYKIRRCNTNKSIIQFLKIRKIPSKNQNDA
jgi:hypothetical protein